MPAALVRDVPRRLTHSVVAGAIALALAGCGSDPSGAGGPPTAPPTIGGTPSPSAAPALTILGQGIVTDRFTAEVTVRGPWVYTSTWRRRSATGNVVYVWNGAGDVPTVVDTLIIDGVTTTGDLQVSDDGALLVVATEPAGSLVIYDLADPAHPRFLARHTSPNVAGGVHTALLGRVDGRLYAFAAVYPHAGAPARLTIVDLGTPSAPREVWSQAMGMPVVHDTFVRDGLLFTANWNEGVVVWDVGGGARGGSPAAPVRIGAFVTRASSPGTADPSVHNVWWLHTDGRKRYLLVGEELSVGGVAGNSSAGDVHVVDVSDLTRPTTWREVAVYRVPGAGTHNFVVDEARGIAYLAYYNGGVRALDVRGELGTCPDAQRTTDGRCDLARMGREIGVALAGTPRTRDPRTGENAPPHVWGVDLSGDALYASDMLGGLFKLRALTR